MKWLITIDAQTDVMAVLDKLQALGCAVDKNQIPVPLGNERVIEIEGPADLTGRAADVPGIRGIYPSSEMTLY
jgi:hypothetical protein